VRCHTSTDIRIEPALTPFPMTIERLFGAIDWDIRPNGLGRRSAGRCHPGDIFAGSVRRVVSAAARSVPSYGCPYGGRRAGIGCPTNPPYADQRPLTAAPVGARKILYMIEGQLPGEAPFGPEPGNGIVRAFTS